jgi:DNA adenine methylase
MLLASDTLPRLIAGAASVRPRAGYANGASLKSPLNYMGGKSRLAERIVSILPADHRCYVEPFCGAAWVLFRKEPSEVEVVNDLDGELVNFWRVVQHHLATFLEHYRFAVISRKVFEWENMKRPETLTDIQRAVRYYYLQRLSFGGRVTGRTFGTSATRPANLNLLTLDDALAQVHWRLERVIIEHLPALECIRRYDRPTTLFYLDPPYWGTAGYAVEFSPADYDALAKALSAIQGRFVLSLNDVPEVRRTFVAFRQEMVRTTYSVENRRTAGARADLARHELLIHNLQRPLSRGGRLPFSKSGSRRGLGRAPDPQK